MKTSKTRIFFTMVFLASTMLQAEPIPIRENLEVKATLNFTGISDVHSSVEIPSGLCGYVGREYSHVCFKRWKDSGTPYLEISRLNCESTKPPKNCRYIDSTLDLQLVDVTSVPQVTYRGHRIVYNWKHVPRVEVIDLKIRFIEGEYEGEWISDGKSVKVFNLK